MSPRIISEEDFANREQKLIDISCNLIANGCISELSMDKLVAAAPYSKGTIYKHFISKEDLILAICNTNVIDIHTLFIRALTFSGNSRERLLAVMVSYLIWSKLQPSQFFTVLAAHSPTVVGNSSQERVAKHHEHEASLMDLFNDEIQSAIDAGELVLPADMVFEQVTFSLWSAMWGAMALVMSKGNSIKLGPMILEREAFRNVQLILDGYAWQPLSQGWNYSDSIKRITDELFKPEIETLKNMGTPFVFV